MSKFERDEKSGEGVGLIPTNINEVPSSKALNC